MKLKNHESTRANAEKYLKVSLGSNNAMFRDGQWEAIDALVSKGKRLLVVQRTGWGKSSVYFIATKLLREKGYGPTIIISPLLALIRNQINAAKKIGINAVTINSTNNHEWDNLIEEILMDNVDCLLISPERLANEDFNNNVLNSIGSRIGLMVIDEIHCISDWGHDFRPDYRRILNILQRLPVNTPVLGTTATANDRVINDIESQLGDVEVHRGSLVRESLCLQAVPIKDTASRFVILSEFINQQLHSGIVYVLTKRDATRVSDWLTQQGINSAAYFSGVENDRFESSNLYREYLEKCLLNNQLKVLVSTTALGMGFDKPDLGFVIHYQIPSSVVSYYQQVGRAGRGIDSAIGLILSGNEDKEIHDFFRRSAFPAQQHIEVVLDTLSRADGMTIRDLEENINLRKGQIEKVLKFLSVENPSTVMKDGNRWFRTSVDFQMDVERINHLTYQREMEWQEIQDYITYNGCLMNFLRKALNDPDTSNCGKCANCIGKSLIETKNNMNKVSEAKIFLKNSEFPLKLNKQVPTGAFISYKLSGNLSEILQSETGRILSRWEDSPWGFLVKQGKEEGHFSDELVEEMYLMIKQRWKPKNKPQWLCAVPSQKHPDLVPDFAMRLAHKLKIPFKNVVVQVLQNEQQKQQHNRFHQCKNLDGVFEINDEIPQTPVLLFDDLVDSGWTLTLISALLRQKGASHVYPIALCSAAQGV